MMYERTPDEAVYAVFGVLTVYAGLLWWLL